MHTLVQFFGAVFASKGYPFKNIFHSLAKKNTHKKIHKKHRIGTVNKIISGGLNQLQGNNLTLNYGVDQDK